MKYVYIEWNDAVSHDDWISEDSLDEGLPLIKTVGIYIKKNKDCYLVALNYDTTNKNYSCIINIPKAWVKTIRFINEI